MNLLSIIKLGIIVRSQIIKKNNMEQSIIMEIKDNTFARQFETTVEEGLV
jgi:hypothetical protein